MSEFHDPQKSAECRDYNWVLDQIDLIKIKIECLEKFILRITELMEEFINGPKHIN